MNILIVSRYFYPDITPRSFRTSELACEFVQMGHSVTVLIPSKNEESSKFAESHNIQLISFGPLTWEPIKIKGNKFEIFVKRILFRSLNLFFDYPDIELMFKIPKDFPYENNYDLVISIAAPHAIHWGVAKALKKNKEKKPVWIADCGDPFMGQDNDTFKHPFYFKALENSWCKMASYIAIPTNKSVNAYYAEFRHKIKIIPQGFKFPEIKKTNWIENNSKIRFAYAGSFIPVMRDPKDLLEQLLSHKKVDFEFHIYSNSLALINPYKDLLGDKLIIHDLVPREILLKELEKFDFLVNFMNVGEKQVPSKLIDYAILGKPILNIERNSVKSDILTEFLNRDYHNSFQVENIEQYKIENVCKQMLSLMNN